MRGLAVRVSRAASALIFITIVSFAATSCSNAGTSSTATETAPGTRNDLTAQELSDFEAGKSALAEYLGVTDPPDIEVVRWVLPEEFSDIEAECLDKHGFPRQADGSYTVPEDQRATFGLAQFECYAAYPVHPRYTREWTEEQIGRQYDWTVQSVIPCLEDQGLIVGEPPPTRSTFIDQWATSPYFPFAFLNSETLTDEEWNELELLCPQQAPSDVLWAGISRE